MRGTTVTVAHAVQLVTEECCSCGVMFGMTVQLKEERLGDKGTFYCPNGHRQHYLGKTHEEQLQEARRATERAHARADAMRDQYDAAERSRRATKGHLTRTKRRIANGVCPCCNRSFDNVAAHMATEHPNYVEEVGDAE